MRSSEEKGKDILILNIVYMLLTLILSIECSSQE